MPSRECSHPCGAQIESNFFRQLGLAISLSAVESLTDPTPCETIVQVQNLARNILVSRRLSYVPTATACQVLKVPDSLKLGSNARFVKFKRRPGVILRLNQKIPTGTRPNKNIPNPSVG